MKRNYEKTKITVTEMATEGLLAASASADGSQPSAPQPVMHIGSLIQRELDRQHRTRAWLAKTIFCSRPNINKIVNRPYINTESLLLISKALNHNFFADIAAGYEQCNPGGGVN